MVGIIDIGGGLRGIYTSGIYDYLLDNNIKIDYCLGVFREVQILLIILLAKEAEPKSFIRNILLKRNIWESVRISGTEC